jgi:agmatine/peptidylarginine deiminase
LPKKNHNPADFCTLAEWELHEVNWLQWPQDNVDSHFIPTNDVWAHDNRPIFVVNDEGEAAITDWIFNGWGDRFPYDLDDRVPAAIGERLDNPVFKAPMVPEARVVEINGKRTFLATSYEELQAATTEAGKPLNLAPLPRPPCRQLQRFTKTVFGLMSSIPDT